MAFSVGDWIYNVTNGVGKIISKPSDKTFIVDYKSCGLEYDTLNGCDEASLKYKTATEVVDALLIDPSFDDLFEH